MPLSLLMRACVESVACAHPAAELIHAEQETQHVLGLIQDKDEKTDIGPYDTHLVQFQSVPHIANSASDETEFPFSVISVELIYVTPILKVDSIFIQCPHVKLFMAKSRSSHLDTLELYLLPFITFLTIV